MWTLTKKQKFYFFCKILLLYGSWIELKTFWEIQNQFSDILQHNFFLPPNAAPLVHRGLNQWSDY